MVAGRAAAVAATVARSRVAGRVDMAQVSNISSGEAVRRLGTEVEDGDRRAAGLSRVISSRSRPAGDRFDVLLNY